MYEVYCVSTKILQRLARNDFKTVVESMSLHGYTCVAKVWWRNFETRNGIDRMVKMGRLAGFFSEMMKQKTGKR